MKNAEIHPSLTAILVGEDKASQIYVALKEKAAKKIGIEFNLVKFSKRSKEIAVIKKLREINRDKSTDGIIVQLPLPKNFDTQKIINAVDMRKDVDGFHPKNLKLFLAGKKDLIPVFPKAILKILESVSAQFVAADKSAVILANSKKFGETMVAALQRKNIRAEYVLVEDIAKKTAKIKLADILITAVGQPGLITGAMVKKGAVIIDGGISKKNKHVFGDVDFQSVRKAASFITPVPGGVGPVTIACLLENVYLASKKK